MNQEEIIRECKPFTGIVIVLFRPNENPTQP